MTGDPIAADLAHPCVIDPRVQKVREFMKAHVRERLTLDQIASSAGMIGPDRLLQLFRPTGESPGHAFKRLKMEEAARRLADSRETSVKGVALELGYGAASLPQFSRDFKARYGVPPSRYRGPWGGVALSAHAAPGPPPPGGSGS